MDAYLIVPGIIPMAIAASLWARWLARRRSRVPPLVKHVPAAVALVVTTTGVATVWGLYSAFSAQGADASEKQSQLASAIALAMNSTAVCLACLVLLLVLLAVATIRSEKKVDGPVSD